MTASSKNPAAKLPRVGAHVSAAGGLGKLLQRADALGVEVIQLHPTAPQNYRQSTLTGDEIGRFHLAVKSHDVPVYFHSIYLINLANPDDKLWHASIGSLEHYLELAGQFGAVGTITHVGSHKGAGFTPVKERLSHTAGKLAKHFKEHKIKPGALIIENTAGGGGTLGRDITEMHDLFKIFSAELPTKICLDTCHLFASGVPVHEPAGFDKWLTEFDQKVGLKNLTAIHLNDSKTPFESNRDRHANLGTGEIGEIGLKHVVQHPKLKHVNFILEVPGSGQGPDKENIDRAKSWRI